MPNPSTPNPTVSGPLVKRAGDGVHHRVTDPTGRIVLGGIFLLLCPLLHRKRQQFFNVDVQELLHHVSRPVAVEVAGGRGVSVHERVGREDARVWDQAGRIGVLLRDPLLIVHLQFHGFPVFEVALVVKRDATRSIQNAKHPGQRGIDHGVVGSQDLGEGLVVLDHMSDQSQTLPAQILHGVVVHVLTKGHHHTIVIALGVL